MDTVSLYNEWLEKAIDDADLKAELLGISGKSAEIDDRFYKELEFGTGGLRGVIGAGTNRMNIYTVAKATQGFAEYILSSSKNPSVAISYDSRIKSDLFAKTAARVFAGNGIKVYIYKKLMPTPMLSFAVRTLNCSAGVMVTASHNPAKYNGYKAYGADGCQLDLDASRAVLDIINRVDAFKNVKYADFDESLKNGDISYIGDDVINSFLNTVKAESVRPDVCKKAQLKIIYTPLNGTGNEPVRTILKMVGINDVTVVPEQEKPDGMFPTAPYPNPEIRQAFDCALKLAATVKPDILLATDPDCDRVGIAVKDGDDYRLMTGNQVGVLLLDYIINSRRENGTLPEKPAAVKTIVTTTLTDKIAKDGGCEVFNVLTGFKFIGGVITELEKKNEENRYIFGFEESYGYLSGGYVRDKDAVDASMLICEMASYYKLQGLSLLEVMEGIYRKYGFYCNLQVSFTCEGESGMERMQGIMNTLREQPPVKLGGKDVTVFSDYLAGTHKDMANGKTTDTNLPQSNVLAFSLSDGSSVTVRPSGTEPKIKVYIEAVSKDKNSAEKHAELLVEEFKKVIGFND